MPARRNASAYARAPRVLRSDIADIEYGNAGRPLTMSFGVAELAPHEPMEALRERSDAALYEAKHSGRDSVVVAEAESPD